MPALKPSPLAPASPPVLPPVKGVRLAVFESGIRYKGRPDVLVAVLEPWATAAGALTRSKTRSASVDWCRLALESGQPARGLVVNAGNSNAFTGKVGVASVEAINAGLAGVLGVSPTQWNNVTQTVGQTVSNAATKTQELQRTTGAKVAQYCETSKQTLEATCAKVRDNVMALFTFGRGARQALA